MSREIMQQALEFCQYAWRDISLPQYAFEELEKTIAALEAELAKPEQTTDHYAEVYIRVGDLHVKEVLSQMQFSWQRIGGKAYPVEIEE